MVARVLRVVAKCLSLCFVRLTELICCCLDVLDCYGVVVRVLWVVICAALLLLVYSR